MSDDAAYYESIQSEAGENAITVRFAAGSVKTVSTDRSETGQLGELPNDLYGHLAQRSYAGIGESPQKSAKRQTRSKVVTR